MGCKRMGAEHRPSALGVRDTDLKTVPCHEGPSAGSRRGSIKAWQPGWPCRPARSGSVVIPLGDLRRGSGAEDLKSALHDLRARGGNVLGFRGIGGEVVDLDRALGLCLGVSADGCYEAKCQAMRGVFLCRFQRRWMGQSRRHLHDRIAFPAMSRSLAPAQRHRRRSNDHRQGPLFIIVCLLVRNGCEVTWGMEEDPAAIRARGTVLMIRVDADDQ